MKKKLQNEIKDSQPGRFTRRQFVKNTAAFGLAVGVAPIISYPAASYGNPKKSLVAVVTGDRIQATKKALGILGGMRAFVKKGNKVVLKPNMSFPHPHQRATNTHYEVVSTVAAMCMEAGAREVLVLDYPFNRPEPCLQFSGIREACKKINNVYTLAVVDEKFFSVVPVRKGKAIREVKIIKDVLDCNVFINIPTAKSHTTTGVSLGLKGLMGIIWDRRYFHSKVDINQAIADLNSEVRVDLTILDASRALVSGGPTGPGRIEYPKTIVAGTDPVAVDAMGVSLVKWYGQSFSGAQVKHIAAAHEMGLGTLNLKNVEILKASL